MLTIWRFTDGKRGHENQSLGLVEALCRLTSSCRVETLTAAGGWLNVFNWLGGQFPAGKNLPKPDLIIGAGHATHWPMLAARRVYGGKIAVLMKPSLPLSWFDWVITPEHDLPDHPHPNSPLQGAFRLACRNRSTGAERAPRISRLAPSRGRGHVWATQGPINRIQPSSLQDSRKGLMLIGGPSGEYEWSETALLKQIHLIALHQPEISWQLTTSRRTSAGLLGDLARLGLSNVKAVAHDAVGADWLPAQLAYAAQVWVTPDSASMVYEALTSGATVGCFDLPYANPSRVARGLEKLVHDKRLTTFSEWERSGKLQPNDQPLNEAERCARQLLSCLPVSPSPTASPPSPPPLPGGEGDKAMPKPINGEGVPHAPSPLRGEGWGGGEMPEQANNLPLPPPVKGGGIESSLSPQGRLETSSVRKLTVLQVLPALQSGGVERGTLEVGKYLVEHGHRSFVISAGGRMVEQLLQEGSEHVTWDIGRKSLWTLRLIPQLRRFLVENKVDILHARSRIPAWICYLAWKGMPKESRPRFVTTVHGLYSANAYSAIMTRGEKVIAVSETARDYILRNYPKTPPQKIVVIHRGVNRGDYPHGYRPPTVWIEKFFQAFPNARDKTLITLPGRISRVKGHEDFIEIMLRLKQAGLPVHGLIVGGAADSKRAYLNKLRQIIKSAGLENDISFTGQRSDMKEILAISSLALAPAKHPESFGRTTLESLYLGVPTAGYDHGGVSEILRCIYPHGLLPMGDLDAAIRIITGLLRNPPPVPEDDLFPLSRMLEETLNLYETLANEAAP